MKKYIILLITLLLLTLSGCEDKTKNQEFNTFDLSKIKAPKSFQIQVFSSVDYPTAKMKKAEDITKLFSLLKFKKWESWQNDDDTILENTSKIVLSFGKNYNRAITLTKHGYGAISKTMEDGSERILAYYHIKPQQYEDVADYLTAWYKKQSTTSLQQDMILYMKDMINDPKTIGCYSYENSNTPYEVPFTAKEDMVDDILNMITGAKNFHEFEPPLNMKIPPYEAWFYNNEDYLAFLPYEDKTQIYFVKDGKDWDFLVDGNLAKEIISIFKTYE